MASSVNAKRVGEHRASPRSGRETVAPWRKPGVGAEFGQSEPAQRA
jgi:hypothetical protein